VYNTARPFFLVFEYLFFKNHRFSLYDICSHTSRIEKMENMKIDSKNEYKRNRVINGNEPHKMMEMEYQKALEKIAKK
jgi:hypothetical protein